MLGTAYHIATAWRALIGYIGSRGSTVVLLKRRLRARSAAVPIIRNPSVGDTVHSLLT